MLASSFYQHVCLPTGTTAVALHVAWIDPGAVQWMEMKKLETDRCHRTPVTCLPGVDRADHVCHAARTQAHRHAAQAYPPHERHNHKATTRTGLPLFGTTEEEEEMEPNQTTERRDTRAHLPLALHPAAAVHCPPDTSRTGALQAFVPPAARTPTAGAGRGLLRPAPRARRTGLLDLECTARS